MKTKIFLSALLAIVTLTTGCQRPQARPEYDRPLPPGQLALRKITNPDEMPDFTIGCHNLGGMQKAIDNSLNYLSKPSSRQFFPYGDITHQQAVDSLKAFKKLIDSGLRGRELHAAIAEQFDVYVSVGCDGQGTVLFTGYYTPIFDGSPAAAGQFQYPLYNQPDDLVKGPDGQILGRRGTDGQITPYPPRAEIERSGILKGKEMAWLSDPFEAYIAHVQGSAKLKMPNGELVTVGYAASNGHEYHSVAEELVKDGRIRRDRMSLSTMIDYFKRHINQVAEYTQRNPRFVFFRKEDGPPRGSLNEPVTPMRTIATDKSIYPRGCLAFISTVMPRMVRGRIFRDPYSGFVLDQDTGGAIRAPGRCDVYMGIGETAGKLAGQTYQEGRLYYLFLKRTAQPMLSDLAPMSMPRAGQ
ncbi:MAG TPA: MltA domain-containing protein [Sedimentisphaerales bacterium]|nr:MltA domain-containing protein [Sedimentisphaerales bacterium]